MSKCIKCDIMHLDNQCNNVRSIICYCHCHRRTTLLGNQSNDKDSNK